MIELVLSDIFDLQQGFAFKSKDFLPEGVPILKIKNVKSSGLSLHQLDYVNESFLDTHGKYIPEHGDALISMSGNRLNGSKETWVGKVALFKEEATFLVNQRVGILKNKNPQEANTAFLVYALSSDYWQLRFAQTATSSGGQANLSTSQILSESVFLPSLSDQKAIAYILGTLDDKIELNQKMNQTLEDIAKAIFKSWFVDFDPVRAKAEGRPRGLSPEISDLFPDELVDSEIGEIPKGWEVVPLDQIGNFRNGLALQKYPPVNGEEQLPVIKIAQLRKGSTLGDDLFASGVPSDYVIDDGDYVFSWSGSLMAKYWVGGKGALNQHLFKVEEKTQPLWFIAGWVEHFMPEFQSIAESKVTTMGHIKREHLKQAMCVIPPGETIDQCGDAINPLKDRAIYSQMETRVLADLRDTLLPKLISGELRIPDAEKFLEEAGV